MDAWGAPFKDNAWIRLLIFAPPLAKRLKTAVTYPIVSKLLDLIETLNLCVPLKLNDRMGKIVL